jgi:hypothetical protein
VLLAIPLDLGDAAIPGLLFRWVTRPLAQLVPLGGRVVAGGEDRHLAAFGQHTLGDRQLAAAGVADFRHLGQLSFVAGELLVEDSSIKVTFDLYGHLMPGTEAEAAALLDRFLGT